MKRKLVFRGRYEEYLAQAKESFPMTKSLRIEDVTTIDKFARIAFPTVFILFNCFYWTYYNFF